MGKECYNPNFYTGKLETKSEMPVRQDRVRLFNVLPEILI